MTQSWLKFPTQTSGWFLLSLLVPLYFGLISLLHSFSQPYIVQDDARLHIVWLQRFIDPQLFPNDFIAHYYQTIQAIGFRTFYWIMAQLGIEPLLLAKLLPTLLALVTTVYLFHLTLFLLPHPACGFLTTLLLNQNIWIKDDLISATPRAFIYPLFVAFLYYSLRRSPLPILICLGLMGLFYPQLVLVELGILGLRLWTRQGFSNRRADYELLLAGIGVALITILPFQMTIHAEFGPIATLAEMRQMPEFGPLGRRAYFGVPPLQFMFAGASGLRLPLFPPILWVSILFPWVLRSRVGHRITAEWPLLVQMGLASIAAFLLAHLLFPQLYLPSRYIFYSFRVLMALAAGIVLFLALDTAKRRITATVPLGLVILLSLVVALTPAIPPLFLAGQGWVIGHQPAIYQFLAQQPKQSLIASLTSEADNLPAFTAQSVLISREFALAYHPSFYQVMQQRIVDLLQAHYSPDLATTQKQLKKYGIDFLLIDRQFADPTFLQQQDWLIHSSFQSIVSDIEQRLQQGAQPALQQVIDRCTALSENNLIILQTDCINTIQSE